jgi:hypothetical protein
MPDRPSGIETQHIQYFAAAEHCSLKRAAEARRTSQFAISRRIRDLEDSTGSGPGSHDDPACIH